MKQTSGESDLKEAKQVMEDEGGANQAGMKQQQAKQSQSFGNPNKQESCEQLDKNGNPIDRDSQCAGKST